MAQTYNVQVEDSEGNKYCPKPDLLTSKEQLSANTKSGKSVDALVVKEINNNLTSQLPSGVKLIVEGSGASAKYYAQIGADAASKKSLGSGKFTAYKGTNTNSITADADYNAVFFVTVHNATSCDIKDCKKNNASISSECLKIRVGNSLDLWIYQDQIKSGDTISFTETANYQYILLLA